MAISRSSNKPSGWSGGALVFSGRPDPVWEPSDRAVAELEVVWRSLDAHTGESPTSPTLGYRGAFLRNGMGQEWFAYGGRVTLKTLAGSESRSDKDRSFEKLLLASAPEGMIPPVRFD